MKRVVSVSLGSSKRDHAAEIELFGEKFRLERIGTDGDIQKMIALIKEFDGKVDAFGLGGIDLYIQAVDRRYTLRDAQKIAAAARLTPIVDGSGLKNTLERRIIRHLAKEKGIFNERKKVLLVCAMDRFGMAEAMQELNCEVIYGDVLYVLGLPFPVTSLKVLALLARLLVPVIRLLPFRLIYPTGEKQEENKPRFPRYFEEADIIAGDFHFIRRYMPSRLDGKTIITNTVTPDDLFLLKKSGVKLLITTTPELEGRSFGTNVMEAMLVALSGKKEELTPQEYESLLEKLDLKPRLVYF
ncbi:MAG: quinate 5-dehydrogenase [Dethiobacteria bacterium]